MKKLIGLALLTILIIALATGCTQKPTKPAASEPTVLKDGTYSVKAAEDQSNWVPEIAITISSGKITDVKYDEVAAMRKSENIEYQKSMKLQKNIDLLAVYSAMQNSLIKSQDASKLDAVAGATKAGESFKALVTDALKDANLDGKYKDGDYSAKGSRDEKNWTPIVNITIKDRKITTVKYDEVSYKVFKYKSKDNAYIAAYKKATKLELAAVYDTLQKALIEKQDPGLIAAIAGATQAHDNFVELAKKAIEKAK